MDEMYKRYGERFNPYLSLDMYPISQNLISPKDVKNYKSKTVASYFGLDGIMFHDASGDVMATMEIMRNYEDHLNSQEAKTGNMTPDYNAGIKVKVTGIARYEKGRIRRIYVNTSDKDVSFYMDTYNLGWSCNDKNMSTDKFNMPDMISQALKMARASSERELAMYK